MKKIISILLVVGLVFMIAACGSSTSANTPSQTAKGAESAVEESEDQSNSTEEPGVCQANGYTVKVIAAHLTADSNGDPLAALEMSFTNDNSSPASFMSTAQAKIFQGGVQMNKDELFLERNFDWDSYYTEVKDGATITVFRAFPLHDTETPIEVVIDIVDMANGKFLASTTAQMDLVD